MNSHRPPESTSKAANSQAASRDLNAHPISQSAVSTVQSNSVKDATQVLGKTSDDNKSKEKGALTKNGPLTVLPSIGRNISSSVPPNARASTEPSGLLIIKHTAPDEAKIGETVVPLVSNHIGANVSHDHDNQSKSSLAGVEPDSSLLLNRKKSSFQITKVIPKGTEKIGLNETIDTKDLSAAVEGSNVAVTTYPEHLPKNVNSQKHSPDIVGLSGDKASTPSTAKLKGGTESRFKIVKIESKDHRKRGRWVCFDFADPAGSGTSAKQRVEESVSNHHDVTTNPSIIVTPDPIYYFPNVEEHRNAQSPFAPAIVYNEGHPVLERNPLESPMSQVSSQTIFRGDEWDSVGGQHREGMYTPGNAAGVSFRIGGSSSNDSCYFSAEQIEGLNSNGGSSGDALMTMLSKHGAVPDSPLYSNIIVDAMSPLTVNVGDGR